jgi:hypothetical protein
VAGIGSALIYGDILTPVRCKDWIALRIEHGAIELGPRERRFLSNHSSESGNLFIVPGIIKSISQRRWLSIVRNSSQK